MNKKLLIQLLTIIFIIYFKKCESTDTETQTEAEVEIETETDTDTDINTATDDNVLSTGNDNLKRH